MCAVCLHVRTGTQYRYCIPVCNTGTQYMCPVCLHVRTCKHRFTVLLHTRSSEYWQHARVQCVTSNDVTPPWACHVLILDNNNTIIIIKKVIVDVDDSSLQADSWGRTSWLINLLTDSFRRDLKTFLFNSVTKRAAEYGLTLWCTLGLLVWGAMQVPRLQLQLQFEWTSDKR